MGAIFPSYPFVAQPNTSARAQVVCKKIVPGMGINLVFDNT